MVWLVHERNDFILGWGKIDSGEYRLSFRLQYFITLHTLFFSINVIRAVVVKLEVGKL